MEPFLGPETLTSTLNTRLHIVLPWRTVFTELPCGTSPSLMLPRFFERYSTAHFIVDYLLRHPATLKGQYQSGLDDYTFASSCGSRASTSPVSVTLASYRLRI
jgi:hypothetical protein